MSIIQVPIGDIITDPRLQMRATIDMAVAAEYAENIDKLPACKVVRGENGEMWLTGGWHRYYGHKEKGVASIKCSVTQGTFLDAIVEACGENEGHGIRRTNEDKRRAVMALLRVPEWSEKSDRMIADACKVGHPLISIVRQEISQKNEKHESQNGDGKEDASGGSSSTRKTRTDKRGREQPAEKQKALCQYCQNKKTRGAELPKQCDLCDKLRQPKEEKKPKSGSEKVSFNDKPFEEIYGKLVRFMDARANVTGKGKRHTACLKHLEALLGEYQAWKRETA